ncbi:alpha-crystallin B chain [Caerostris darwini]|uniref:Alpha-crystallin B chain n=1 Tax=Caerostris darwini TaxID=1538125 RepID=A0AAV4UEI6_9ARAC|nr:alpha-crystallin B chain [Caerostris darwini]
MFPRMLRDLCMQSVDCHHHNIVPSEVFPTPSTVQTPYFVIRQPLQVPVDPRRSDANKYQVMINVKQFRPDEIDVKIVDNFVVISGKHEEKADEYGFVAREFTRRCLLPDNTEPRTVTSSLCPCGVLTIQATPKKNDEIIVPIPVQQPAAVVVAQKDQAAERNSEEPKQ